MMQAAAGLPDLLAMRRAAFQAKRQSPDQRPGGAGGRHHPNQLNQTCSCNAARQLLGWSLDRLAVQSDLGPSAVGHFEVTGKMPGRAAAIRHGRILAIRTVLEAAGVEFIQENDGDAWVQLKGRS
jgi:hypothetical protein